MSRGATMVGAEREIFELLQPRIAGIEKRIEAYP
jgi:hypothetical protein